MCIMIIIIMIFIFLNQQLLISTTIITTSEKIEQLSSLKMMKKYMRTIYNEINYNQKRTKRQIDNFSQSNLFLSNNIDSIVSLFNQYNYSNYYYFEYQSSLENLTNIEFILPIKYLTNYSRINIKLNQFNLLFKQPFKIEKNFFKINLTTYIQKFPLKFSIKFNQISLYSPGFLTLYFRRLTTTTNSRSRRDIFDDNQLVTYPNNPSYCQVRPYRTSFAELNWTSWIIEPNSYEMNVCSGICQTDFRMPAYLTMQNILHEISPKKIPKLCCKPKRFSSTILLYYNGPNLILKRHDNMRVIECSCS